MTVGVARTRHKAAHALPPTCAVLQVAPTELEVAQAHHPHARPARVRSVGALTSCVETPRHAAKAQAPQGMAQRQPGYGSLPLPSLLLPNLSMSFPHPPCVHQFDNVGKPGAGPGLGHVIISKQHKDVSPADHA